MKQLNHGNILKLHATCLSIEPLYLLTEFMSNGTLHDYLFSHPPFFRPSNLEIASQVANGMAYMEQQGCIHRNLSSHTILVGNGDVFKVANFSCAKMLEPDQEIYQAPSNEVFKPPIRWSAPESLLYQRFSSKSDVWSFGIILYDIECGGTLLYYSGMTDNGEIPYSGLTDKEILRRIQRDSKKLEKHFFSNDKMLHGFILKAEPAHRPSFKSLKKNFQERHLLQELSGIC